MRVSSAKNIASALSAGLLNGLLGTGGGIPLWFAAIGRDNKKAAFATSSTGVLALSFFSLLLYAKDVPPLMGEGTLFLWFALLGGALGAFLLSRVPLGLVRTVFALLLIGSGGYSRIRTAYDVFLA